MAEIDLGVYKTLGNIVNDGLKAYQQGYSNVNQSTKDQRDILEFAQTYGQQDVQNQLKNLASQIENAKSQTEYDALKREYDYRVWDAKRPIDLKADGSYDFQGYLKAATDAGFGDYAKSAMKTYADNLSAPMQKQQQNIGLIRERAIEFAKGLQGQDFNNKDVKQAITDYVANIKNQTGIDINAEFGNNWAQTLVTAQRTPEQLRTDRQVYDTPNGRNANSQQSITLRNTLNQMGAQIPENVSAFEIMSNETYRTLIDKLPNEVRVGALQNIGESNVQMTKVNDLKDRIAALQRDTNLKPIEKLINGVLKLGNSEYTARLTQIVNELKALGINVDESSDMAGVNAALQAKLGQLEVGQGGQRAILENQNLGAVSSTPPISQQPTKKPQEAKQTSVGTTTYTITNKATGESFGGITQAQIDKLKSHSNAGLFTITKE